MTGIKEITPEQYKRALANGKCLTPGDKQDIFTPKELYGDDIIAATLDRKPLYPVSVLEGKTVTIAEPKDGYTAENRTRWLTRSFEATVEAKITGGFVWRYITGTCSNNELRMHHEPMKRRRGNSRKMAWKVLKVVRTGRGVMVRKNRRWNNDQT